MDNLFIEIQPINQQQESSNITQLPINKEDGDEYPIVDYSEVKFPDFQNLKRLGRGSYGCVVQCFFRGKFAAAKLVETDIDQIHIRNEAKLLNRFNHKNIIGFFALFCGDQLGLILELVVHLVNVGLYLYNEFGSRIHRKLDVISVLHQHKHIHYQLYHVLTWSKQIISAIHYLHSLGFIHRDLKPSNLLLSRDFITLKLCDFGTTAEIRTSMTNNRGSAAWMAPEVFRGKKYNQKCDIFSLGIVMWETITRRQPFYDENTQTQNPYTILWQVSEGRRPAIIEDCLEPIMDLITRCWAGNPKDRPYIDEIAKIIGAISEIFPPNYMIPLIDRCTRQAFVEHTSTSPHCQSLWNYDEYSSQTQPNHQSTKIDYRRGHSRDMMYLKPNQESAASHSTSLSDIPRNVRAYSPNIFNNSSNHTSTSIQNAQPYYSPCLTLTNSPPNFTNIVQGAPIFARQNEGESAWERSNHSPSSGILEKKNGKLRDGFKKIYKGLKKELSDISHH